MNINDLRFAKSHEWVRVENSAAKVGITDYAQENLGDVVNVDMPKVGAAARAGHQIGSVDSVKAVSDIYSPVSGVVREINETVISTPEIVNQDPYGTGWLLIVEIDDPSELESLMDNREYEEYVKTL